MSTYQCFKVFKNEEVSTALVTENRPKLAQGEVLVEVAYSSVNYKDALATKANTGVIRSYPLTLGIDLAGSVIESLDERYKQGDLVLATGYGLGVSHDGGFSQLQKLPADWLVKLPKGLSLKTAMAFGTAGFTACLAVEALKKQGLSEESRVLVTGATGGVGSIALGLLKKIGCHKITALSRKKDHNTELLQAGATEISAPADLFPEKIRPLAKQQFDFVVDTVGGSTLSSLLPMISYNGSIATCGNAGGIKLETTVLPFILRGVSLLGIDSVEVDSKTRTLCWQKLAENADVLNNLVINETTLDQLSTTIESLLSGTHVGRTIVTIKEETK